MTTEPTQRTEADALNELRVKAERDLATANQRIAALESQLRTQATEHSLANRRLEDEIGRLQKKVERQTLHADALELTEAVRLARKFDVETVHLQERVKQLEGLLSEARELIPLSPQIDGRFEEFQLVEAIDKAIKP